MLADQAKHDFFPCPKPKRYERILKVPRQKRKTVAGKYLYQIHLLGLAREHMIQYTA
jgi:hypothetical protein